MLVPDECGRGLPPPLIRRRQVGTIVGLKACSYLSSTFLVLGVVLIALSPTSDNNQLRSRDQASLREVSERELPLLQTLLRGRAHFGIDMLAAKPRTGPSSWSKHTLEDEEKTLKDRVIKLETAFANQPEENRQIHDMMDQVKIFYGPRGLLQTDVHQSLVRARVELEGVQRNVSADPKFHRFLDALFKVRSAAAQFLKRNRAWDKDQDERLRDIRDGEEQIRRKLDATLNSASYELRWWWRKMGLLEQRVADLHRKYEWEVTKGVYKLRPQIEEKGEALMKEIFKQGGLWDQAEAAADAYAKEGLQNETQHAGTAQAEAGEVVARMEAGVEAVEEEMEAHGREVAANATALAESMRRLRAALALTVPVLKESAAETEGELGELQAGLDARAEAMAVRADPCLGSEVAGQALQRLLAAVLAANRTAARREAAEEAAMEGRVAGFLRDRAEMIRKRWEGEVAAGRYGQAARKNETEGLLLAEAVRRRDAEEGEEEERLQKLLDERALILDILRMMDAGGLSAGKVKRREAELRREAEGGAGVGRDDAVLAEVRAVEGMLSLRDREEVSAVRKLLLEMLRELDRSEAMLREVVGRWRRLAADHSRAVRRWGAAAEAAGATYAKLEGEVRELAARSEEEAAGVAAERAGREQGAEGARREGALAAAEVAAVRAALASSAAMEEQCRASRRGREGAVPERVRAGGPAVVKAWGVLMERVRALEAEPMSAEGRAMGEAAGQGARGERGKAREKAAAEEGAGRGGGGGERTQAQARTEAEDGVGWLEGLVKEIEAGGAAIPGLNLLAGGATTS